MEMLTSTYTPPGDGTSRSIANVVDAHFHVWEIENTNAFTGWPDKQQHAEIYADFRLDDYDREVTDSSVPVKKSIFVQTINRNSEEVLHLAKDLSQSPESKLAGIVAGIQLDSCTAESVQQQIGDIRRSVNSYQKSGNLLCGARHILALEKDAGVSWLSRDDVLQNASVLEENSLAFDLLATQHQHTYNNLVPLLRQHPNLHFVLDHIAKPDMKHHKRWCEWQTLIDRLARLHPNVYCKISGLVTEADWQTWSAEDDLKPYVEYAVNAFGTNRCMYGSDWPVFKLARDGTYRSVFDAFLTCLPSSCGAHDLENLLHNTAERAYGI